MIRTQIQLSEAQFAALKKLAAAHGVSMASEIRMALDRHLEIYARGLSPIEKALSATRGFRSGRSDVSVNHDEHLTQAFE